MKEETNKIFDIVKVYDKITKEVIPNDKINIKTYLSPSSNIKTEVLRIFINDIVIKKNNSLMVEYKCNKCNRINIVCLNNLTRKLNNNTEYCNTCKNQEDNKYKKHHEFMLDNSKNIINGLYEKNILNKVSLSEKILNDEKLFENMDDDFKDNYFRKHMTQKEFDLIKPKIISFQNNKFTDLSNFEYYPCVSIPNQMQFNPYLYDKTRDVLEKITYITFKCDNCEENFCNRDLNIQKNKYRILCKNCNFTNNTFKIRTTKNINGDIIKYQSKFELKLINFCNENNIILTNGPNIKYNLQNKEKIYRVDFMINSLGLLIECKDNHHWHKQNIETGQWNSKETAAKNYVLNNNLNKYLIIFPHNYMNMINYIRTLADKI